LNQSFIDITYRQQQQEEEECQTGVTIQRTGQIISNDYDHYVDILCSRISNQ
jgi:hypothetical protein